MRFAHPLQPLLVTLVLLGGCDRSAPAGAAGTSVPSSATPGMDQVDPLAAHDGVPDDMADNDPRLMMRAQVVLDRLGFTPGVIDGQAGLSTHNAIAGFQEASGLPPTGEMDGPTREKLGQWGTIPATRVVTIPANFAAGPFVPVPKGPDQQARLPALGYGSLDEKLAERFHTTIATLRALNPGGFPAGSAAAPATAGPPVLDSDRPARTSAVAEVPGAPPLFHAGQQVRVPNIGNDRIYPAALDGDALWQGTLATLGIGTDQPRVAKIVVSKAKGMLKGYDAAGKLVAVYTATMGSQHDPLPLGQWKINGVSRNPKFHYNPALFWDAGANDRKALLPPGPNGPVGVVWIDLSKPHYGIHGTPNPETIGRAESHGCVRLTNWDAARLALMVRPGTEVLFTP